MTRLAGVFNRSIQFADALAQHVNHLEQHGQARKDRLRSVLNGYQQFRIDTPQARQRFGIHPIGLPIHVRDQLHAPGVGYDHFVTQLAEQTARPRRVRANLHNTIRVFAVKRPNRLPYAARVVRTRSRLTTSPSEFTSHR